MADFTETHSRSEYLREWTSVFREERIGICRSRACGETREYVINGVRTLRGRGYFLLFDFSNRSSFEAAERETIIRTRRENGGNFKSQEYFEPCVSLHWLAFTGQEYILFEASDWMN